ncbi:MAG: Hsp20/alpha crystallin family protein [Chloroflexota bacterium]
MWISTRSIHYRSADGSIPGWRPAIDVYEVEGEFHVVVDIAGVSEDRISVALDGDVLSIRGEREPVCDDRQRSVHEMGILYGPFEADVYLPHPVDSKSVSAVYESGLLHVTLKRVEPTKISISTRE